MKNATSIPFPVAVRWAGGRLTTAAPPGKAPLEVAPPPEFSGGLEGVWSPEDLYVAAAASCFAVTMLAVADRRDVPIRDLAVNAVGAVGKRADARLGFTRVELDVEVETDRGREEDVLRAARDAERGCLVAVSLDAPVEARLRVRIAGASRPVEAA